MTEENFHVDLVSGRQLAGLTCQMYLSRRSPGEDRESYDSAANFGLALAVRHYNPSRGASWPYYVIHVVRRQLYREDVRRYGYDRVHPLPRMVSLESILAWEGGDPARIQRHTERLAVENLYRAGIRRVLATLNPSDQRLLFCRFWEGHTFREIALDLGISHETVRKREHEALRRLGLALVEHGALEGA